MVRREKTGRQTTYKDTYGQMPKVIEEIIEIGTWRRGRDIKKQKRCRERERERERAERLKEKEN